MSNDERLTEAQRALLPALLDTLVPASDDGEMPSASETAFDTYLVTQGRGSVPLLQAVLDQLGAGFADLSPEERHARLATLQNEQIALFSGLLACVYDGYYQDDRVREKIGMVRGPVFPQGNDVVQGDLSLLDPVIENAYAFRYRSPTG